MQRRDFLAASAATVAGATAIAANQSFAQSTAAKGREYYEWRTYQINPMVNSQPVRDYLEKAALPALNRLGCTKVGVFTELNKGDNGDVHMLVVYPSLDVFSAAATKLPADRAFASAAAAYWQLPKSAAAYNRIESWLMIAFEGMPQLVPSPLAADNKPRMFELRIYESHSEAAGLKKIEMFNSGEIDVMRRAGMGPVFYGQTIIGGRMPNLTYLLSGENLDEHKKHWGAFGADPEWRRLKAIPEYADTAIVSGIRSKFLAPTAFSQI